MDLVPIGGGHQLAPAPAAAFLRAVAAGCPVTITSSYRDPVRQQQMRTEYLAALAAWYRRPVGPKPTYVAAVANSEHVTGNALDLKDPAIAWMHAHPEYGFVFTDPTERWHVAYRAARDVHRVDHPVITLPEIPDIPVITGPDPLTPTATEDDDMVNDITELYTRILGRDPGTDTLVERLGHPLAPAVLANNLLDAPLAAEPLAVVAAYREYLRRDPAQADIAFRVAHHATVREMRAAIKASAAAGAQ